MVKIQNNKNNMIIINKNPDQQILKAAKELVKYGDILGISNIKILQTNDVSTIPAKVDTLFILSTYDNELCKNFVKADDDFKNRQQGTYALRTLKDKETSMVCIIGKDPIAVIYGTYSLIEYMGVTFTLSGDLTPEKSDLVTINNIDRLCEPAIGKKRGFQIPMLDVNSGIQGLKDYKKLIDQMVKLRLNYINFFVCASEPWLDYTFRGVKNIIGDINSKQSGYLFPKLVVPDPSTKNIRIGKKHFKKRPFMAPIELQDVKNREDGIAKFQKLIQNIIEYGHKSGIKISIALLLLNSKQ